MMGRARIEVGGRTFITTLQTLEKGGKGSNLYQTVYPTGQGFFDRDCDMFSILLNMLRTGVVHPKPDSSTMDRLIDEAEYYGIAEFLKSADGRAPLDGLDLEKAKPITTNGIDIPSAIATGADGSLWVGHGSKITAYNWALRKQKTTLTEFTSIEAFHRVSDNLAACGASDLPGLHLYDVVNGVHTKRVVWTDANDPRVYNPVVKAISSNESSIFASFESGQRLDNTVTIVDKETSQITRELGRQNGSSSHTKAATKLQWMPARGLLLVGSVQGGSFGFSGYMRLWDVRAEKVVWDWKEPNFQKGGRVAEQDMFSDMVVDEDLGAIFKVSVLSGALSLADLRHLDTQDPWLELVENSEVPEKPTVPGANKKLVTYNKQVYVSRGADVEVWAEVPLAESFKKQEEKEYWETSFGRSTLEYPRYSGQEVTCMRTGGNRLFVTRKDFQGVEVWETHR